MDDKLLEIICCPETHQPLRHADAELVTDLNLRIEAGTLLDRVDEKVGQKIDGGLLREDDLRAPAINAVQRRPL